MTLEAGAEDRAAAAGCRGRDRRPRRRRQGPGGDGRRARRLDRPAGRIDLPYHLVARAQGAAPRRATTSSATMAGPLSTRRSRSPSPRRGSRCRHLFLDLDGVLADFDAGARKVLGMSPTAFEARYGKREFWRRLARAKDFYGTLPLMPDAWSCSRPSGISTRPSSPAFRSAIGPRRRRFAGPPSISRHEDHHHHGPRQVSAHDRHGRAGRRPRRPSRQMGECRRHLHPPQERARQPGQLAEIYPSVVVPA